MSAKARIVFRNARGATYASADGLLWNDNCTPSGDWKLTGAVEYGRGYTAGGVVRRYTLTDVLEGKVPWFWRNGKQRCYPTDLDHGTHREWRSPELQSVSRGS